MLITDSFSLSLQQATQGFTASTHFFIKTIKAWAKVDGYMDQKGAVFQTIGIISFPFGQNTTVTFLEIFFGHIFCLQIDIFDEAVLLVLMHLPGHRALGVMSTIVHLPNNLWRLILLLSVVSTSADE